MVPDTEEGEYPQPPDVTWKPKHASELFTNPKEVWRKQKERIKWVSREKGGRESEREKERVG